MDTPLMDLLWIAMNFLVLVPAIVIHEVSHGYAAYRLGDPTAKMVGRLTLNPLKHVDPFGTVIMPILLLVSSGGRFAFGYAKPVPFNPRYFQDRRHGTLITGIAGPASNLAMALASALFFRFGVFLGLDAFPFGRVLLYVFAFSTYVNLLLLFFNMLPIPGLDGSHVVQRFLPAEIRLAYQRAARYGMIILIALFFFVPAVIQTYFGFTLYPVFRLLTGFNAGPLLDLLRQF